MVNGEGKLLEMFKRETERLGFKEMFRQLLLLLWGIVVLATALDEREFDPQVAPPLKRVPKPSQLWRSFASQFHQLFSRLQAKPVTPPPPSPPAPTVKTRMGSTSTTSEPELQFYGALNPIYQTGNF